MKTCVDSGVSRPRQLEATGTSISARPVATEDVSSETKVHLHPNADGEKYIKKFDDMAKKFKPLSEEEHDFYKQKLHILNSTSKLFNFLTFQ